MALIDSGKSFDKEIDYKKMNKKLSDMDTVQYPLRIPSSLYKQVRIKLASDGVKLRTVLLQMLEEYIKK